MRKMLAKACLVLLGATPFLGSAADVDVRVILSGEVAPACTAAWTSARRRRRPAVRHARRHRTAAGSAREGRLPARPAGPREELGQALPALQRLRAAGLLREVGRVRTRLQGQGQEGKIARSLRCQTRCQTPCLTPQAHPSSAELRGEVAQPIGAVAQHRECEGRLRLDGGHERGAVDGEQLALRLGDGRGRARRLVTSAISPNVPPGFTRATRRFCTPMATFPSFTTYMHAPDWPRA